MACSNTTNSTRGARGCHAQRGRVHPHTTRRVRQTAYMLTQETTSYPKGIATQGEKPDTGDNIHTGYIDPKIRVLSRASKKVVTAMIVNDVTIE